MIAASAAYSYVRLGVYYKDEGATYLFFKRTFPNSPFATSLIGWWVVFGYISTLSLYAYTFSPYAINGFSFAQEDWVRKGLAGAVIGVFALINVLSVKGMGKIEDLMVYTKLIFLIAISLVLMDSRQSSLPIFIETSGPVSFSNVLIVAAITFVTYEGLQLVINAVNEMENPERNIPRAIYAAIGPAIPFDDTIATRNTPWHPEPTMFLGIGGQIWNLPAPFLRRAAPSMEWHLAIHVRWPLFQAMAISQAP